MVSMVSTARHRHKVLKAVIVLEAIEVMHEPALGDRAVSSLPNKDVLADVAGLAIRVGVLNPDVALMASPSTSPVRVGQSWSVVLPRCIGTGPTLPSLPSHRLVAGRTGLSKSPLPRCLQGVSVFTLTGFTALLHPKNHEGCVTVNADIFPLALITLWARTLAMLSVAVLPTERAA